jgi:hypothetical protein
MRVGVKRKPGHCRLSAPLYNGRRQFTYIQPLAGQERRKSESLGLMVSFFQVRKYSLRGSHIPEQIWTSNVSSPAGRQCPPHRRPLCPLSLYCPSAKIKSFSSRVRLQVNLWIARLRHPFFRIDFPAFGFQWPRMAGTEYGMDINFYTLIVASGSKAGAREQFELLMADLVRIYHRTVRRIDASSGDWGIDVFVGDLDGVISVWQSKFFIDGVKQSQKGEIRDSFATAVNRAEQQGYVLDAWTLCIPVSMDPETTKWWDGWKKRKEKETGVRIGLWDETELRALLRSPDATTIRNVYFGSKTRRTPIPVYPLPTSTYYEDMLFIKQLKAAGIMELGSAKRQFFNADLLAREVADKGVVEEVQTIETMRAETHAVWETRFNERCAPPPSDRLLPGFYGEVMKAIEVLHGAGERFVIPLSLVHRLGSMHQVVEEGAAGWVYKWREIVEAHRG